MVSITKSDAKKLCRENGISVGNNITFSSKNSTQDTYWANPNIKILKENWTLILNDTNNSKIHVFTIPQYSIKENEIIVRSDKPQLIDIQIEYGNKTFLDRRSKIQFNRWFVKTIGYGK
jgi:hypothetical protein